MASPIERVNALLENEFGLYDLAPDTPLFSSERLDSMDVLRLIAALEQEFGISIPAFDVSLETFDTQESIVALISGKLS